MCVHSPISRELFVFKWNKPQSKNVPSDMALNESSDQGPVVQSVVSLTSSLRVTSLTVLGDSMYNILIFFAEKM